MTKHISSFGIIPIQKRSGKILVLLVKHVSGHYWGFPKGKAIPGEVPHETARRELSEETGLEIKEMFSGRLFHEAYTFEKNGHQYAKEVVYFPAFVTGEVICAHPEEVEKIEWYPIETLENILTYGPSRQIATEFKQWVSEINL